MKILSTSHTIDLTYPQVMGILNVTPDSFSDGGRYQQRDIALRHVEQMVQAGATFIDVGGESTRPHAQVISIDEELSRVIPVIETISRYFEVWISIDTSKPEVMRAAADAGAHLINDIYALQKPKALEIAAQTGLAVCLMHMQGTPQNMQQQPVYNDVVKEVEQFFVERISICNEAGITKDKLLLDPGFGFGKNLQHNYQLLAQLSSFNAFEVPLLVGMSRKSMIGQLLNVPPMERLSGSVACAVIAVMQGAKIVRAHDVKETVDAIRVAEATLAERK